jgi:Protein of unknown function (DUF2934)
MTDRHDRIREIAYFLWLEEGCPDGGADRHWRAAEEMLDSDELERKGVEGEAPGDPVVDSPAAPGAPRARAK